MATLAITHPTLADQAKRLDPNGKVDAIVEILNETNEALDQMVWIEGNLPTGHRSTIRTGLPQPTWRKLYGGVQPTRSTTTQVTDNTGMLEAYAEVDKALADLNGNTSEFRLSEDRAHIEGMNQEMAQTLFYGNEGPEPEAFTGLSPRFNDLSAENADNIIDAGGSGSDNTSIWYMIWGENTVHGIYPKGSIAGLSSDNKGQVTIEDIDGNGGRMEGYRTHYLWKPGLTVRDWRYIVRICNIDVSDLNKDITGNSADLADLLSIAFETVPSRRMGREAIYCNRTISAMLRRQVVTKVGNSTLAREDVAGRKVDVLDGAPIYRMDQLSNAEARVV